MIIIQLFSLYIILSLLARVLLARQRVQRRERGLSLLGLHCSSPVRSTLPDCEQCTCSLISLLESFSTLLASFSFPVDKHDIIMTSLSHAVEEKLVLTI